MDATCDLLVAIIPQDIMDFSPSKGQELVLQAKDMVNDQMLHLNEYYDLGLDLTHLAIESGPRIILTES